METISNAPHGVNRLFTGNHLDLCSGIGGFALAAKWAGLTTVQFVEINKFCQKVLRKNFPNIPIHDDIHTFSARSLRGRIKLLTGGYPCQGESLAGDRRGEEDDRWLGAEVLRIIGEARPDCVLLENVAGHATLSLDTMLHGLEAQNYTAQAFIVPACAVNSPQERSRVLIMAHAISERRQKGGHGSSKEVGTRSRPKVGGSTPLPEMVADAMRTGRRELHTPAIAEGTRLGDWCNHAGRCGNGRGIEWVSQSEVLRVANGFPNRMDRIEALGNAVVPLLMFELICFLLSHPYENA